MNMLFVSRIKKSIIVAAPFLLHLFMVIAVGLYTVACAYVMRHLENTEINRINRENGHSIDQKLKRDSNNIIVTGSELAVIAQSVHPCLKKALNSLTSLTYCGAEVLEKISIAAIDDCYRKAEISINQISVSMADYANRQSENPEFLTVQTSQNKWDFPNSLIFAFTVITTIGYGHIAPETLVGRAFCIVFGLIGIPIALLTIADIGMFLNRLVKKIVQLYVQLKNVVAVTMKQPAKKNQAPLSINDNPLLDEKPKEDHQRSAKESLTLALIFLLYLFIGSAVISFYEVDMDFFKALYFNYVTITTIGLGDVVPKSHKYLLFTFIYITIGLSLTTMAVEIAADCLKKLHYYGRKVGNFASQDVWFGGKKMKLKNLIKHLGDQLNVPIEDLEYLNIDNFVQSALQVADGQVDTLRRKESCIMLDRPISFQDIRKEADSRNIEFADGEEKSNNSSNN